MFQDHVYILCKKIPKGRVSTYGEIAHALGCKAYRAVGHALRKNPDFPNTPCFRVVASGGKIGGFNGETQGKEIQRKIKLLEQEGLKIKNNKILNFEEVLYHFE